MWYFWFYKASLKDSKLPFGAIGSTRRNLPSFVRPLKPLGQGQSSSTVIHLLKVSKLPFGAFSSTRPNLPRLCKSGRSRQHPSHSQPFTSLGFGSCCCAVLLVLQGISKGFEAAIWRYWFYKAQPAQLCKAVAATGSRAK